MVDHQVYDRILKDVFLHDHPRFLDRINRGVRIREFVNVELPLTLERRADLVVRLANGHLHHVEFQSYNDPDLPYRQGIECFMIAQRYKRDVDQTVIYFGARKMRMASRLNAGAAGVKYRLIDIRNYRASSFLKRGGPADLVLATLAGDGEKNLRQILEKVNALPEAQRRRTLTQIAAMAGLRKLSGTVTMEMKRMGLPASVLDNELLRDFFADAEAKGRAEGLIEGQTQGRSAVLRTQLEEKFGPLPEWAVARIAGGAAAQADVWAKKVLTARSLEAVIGRK